MNTLDHIDFRTFTKICYEMDGNAKNMLLKFSPFPIYAGKLYFVLAWKLKHGEKKIKECQPFKINIS